MAHDILIVDDEADIRMLIAGVLKDEGYATREAADTPQTLAAIQVRQQIERVAPTGSRVLITGPPGSGKEVVGRLLHARSRRSKGPFVPVNCATMRPERLEIELFGTETRIDGAPRKVGTFERAHGGTLFLDEVADMPLETQGKIVRALQEQTFERVGGSSRVEVDVRVVASSNRELGGESSAGRV